LRRDRVGLDSVFLGEEEGVQSRTKARATAAGNSKSLLAICSIWDPGSGVRILVANRLLVALLVREGNYPLSQTGLPLLGSWFSFQSFHGAYASNEPIA
jgi:hypothetical protein